MKISKQPYPITTLYGLRDRIDPTPDYQRPPAWSKKQKQLLIDTILRGYDVPKMYWQRLEKGAPFEFAVIDGQQRLRTIWEFCGGEFALAKDMDPVDGIEIAKKKYADLDFDLRSKFDIYFLDVVIVDDAIQTDEEDEVRDMFLRLQNGTTLKAQEKRNAMPGQMRDFIKDVAGHRFFENCKFTNSRFAFDHIAAQMVRLEMAGEPTSVRDGDLNKMYEGNRAFDPNGKVAKKVRRVLDYLLRAFPDKTPELERYNAIVLYCLSSTLIGCYAHSGTEEALAKWFIEFETERRKNETLDEEERDPQLIEYRRLTSQSTDSEESIRARLEFIERRFFLAYPDIEPLDETRIFTPEQRLAIYRKNDGHCQLKIKCNGERLAWADWHADHIVAHSNGGKTVVSNGQVACGPCNWVKSNKPDPNGATTS
ncbi:MAG: DUF262 domain-containing protein [Hyphomonas sp.]|nr:DUF262 domain-containing protein [Hyphomonas sp.]